MPVFHLFGSMFSCQIFTSNFCKCLSRACPPYLNCSLGRLSDPADLLFASRLTALLTSFILLYVHHFLQLVYGVVNLGCSHSIVPQNILPIFQYSILFHDHFTVCTPNFSCMGLSFPLCIDALIESSIFMFLI